MKTIFVSFFCAEHNHAMCFNLMDTFNSIKRSLFGHREYMAYLQLKVELLEEQIGLEIDHRRRISEDLHRQKVVNDELQQRASNLDKEISYVKNVELEELRSINLQMHDQINALRSH